MLAKIIQGLHKPQLEQLAVELTSKQKESLTVFRKLRVTSAMELAYQANISPLNATRIIATLVRLGYVRCVQVDRSGDQNSRENDLYRLV